MSCAAPVSAFKDLFFNPLIRRIVLHDLFDPREESVDALVDAVRVRPRAAVAVRVHAAEVPLKQGRAPLQQSSGQIGV